MRDTHCQEHADRHYICFLISEHVEEDILGADWILGRFLVTGTEKRFCRASSTPL